MKKAYISPALLRVDLDLRDGVALIVTSGEKADASEQLTSERNDGPTGGTSPWSKPLWSED